MTIGGSVASQQVYLIGLKMVNVCTRSAEVTFMWFDVVSVHTRSTKVVLLWLKVVIFIKI